MKLYLLRHGQTDWNLTWKLQGSTDIPLNEEGIRQAREAAERYADLPFTVVYSSPLSRALQTAQIIAEPHKLPVLVDERLKEMNFGLLEGLTPEESAGTPELQQSRTNLFDHPELYVPAGQGETFNQVDARCRGFLEELRTRYDIRDHILISSHGALCKGLIRAAENNPVDQFWYAPPQPNCAVIEIDW